MMHNVAGKSMQRNSAHRAALRRNFTVSLLTHERVETTLPKAKALRPWVEKVISLGRKKTLHNIRRAVSLLQDKAIVKKLFDEIGPRYASRQGGYTRILRLADYRIGDGGTRALIELVDNSVLDKQTKAREAAQAAATADAAAAAGAAGAKS